MTGGERPRIRWRMATSWPESLGTIYGGVLTLAARVRDMSGGCFTITTYAAGELVPGLQVLNAVQSGSAECGHTASYYYIVLARILPWPLAQHCRLASVPNNKMPGSMKAVATRSWTVYLETLACWDFPRGIRVHKWGAGSNNRSRPLPTCKA